MKEGEGIQKWLAIVIIIIIIASILAIALFLPIFLGIAKGETYYISFSFQVDNGKAIIETNDPMGLRISEVNLVTAPVLMDNRIFVAIRDLENFGMTIEWVQETKTVLVYNKNNIRIEYTISSNSYYFNRQKRKMDVAPFIKDGRTFIPVRYFAQALGATEITFIPETISVIIKWPREI